MNTRSPAVSRFDQNFPPRRHHGYNRGMEDVIVIETGPRLSELILPALGVAFAAFCVWLTVRILSRRERWAKRTAIGLVVSLPVLYVLSIGPAAWLNTRHLMPQSLSIATRHFYDPIYWILGNGPEPVSRAITWYAQLWSASVPPDTPAQPFR